MDLNEHTENGITYRVGDRVVSAPGRSDHEDEPNLTGRLVSITADSDGEATYWITWSGAGKADAQGPGDFTILPADGGVTSEQISEARNWIADAYPQNPLDMSDTHPVYSESAESVQRFVDRRYPGGWPAFVAECCTYVQL